MRFDDVRYSKSALWRIAFAFAALAWFAGCDMGPKKLTVAQLTIAGQDATKEDAALNLNAFEVFEFDLKATGSGIAPGSIAEIQFFSGPNPATDKTRCNFEQEGNQLKIFIRLLAPENPIDGELRISQNGQKILVRKVKVVRK